MHSSFQCAGSGSPLKKAAFKSPLSRRYLPLTARCKTADSSSDVTVGDEVGRVARRGPGNPSTHSRAFGTFSPADTVDVASWDFHAVLHQVHCFFCPTTKPTPPVSLQWRHLEPHGSGFAMALPHAASAVWHDLDPECTHGHPGHENSDDAPKHKCPGSNVNGCGSAKSLSRVYSNESMAGCVSDTNRTSEFIVWAFCDVLVRFSVAWQAPIVTESILEICSACSWLMSLCRTAD